MIGEEVTEVCSFIYFFVYSINIIFAPMFVTYGRHWGEADMFSWKHAKKN